VTRVHTSGSVVSWASHFARGAFGSHSAMAGGTAPMTHPLNESFSLVIVERSKSAALS
jgi:hypothetical protein